jgi:Family of unknown function (DUF6064)
MRIPFTIEQFLDVFARYNEAIWPAQIGAYALGALALLLALRGRGRPGKAVPLLLAGAWLFVGAAYHIAFFAPVNPVARLFGAGFLVQAALFAWVGLRGRLAFGWSGTARAAVGLALVAYAMVLYPLLGAMSGHGYPRAPVFGVTPCPTTIFTFGVLLLAEGAVPAWLLVLPGLWAVLGVSAAVQLGVREDLGLVVAALLAAALLYGPRALTGRRRRARGAPAPGADPARAEPSPRTSPPAPAPRSP